ncbi:hypothetical protein BOTBODRAFT_175342 [Botryobasidium botryosum FD-172 SS1]|uniref:Uncharacterized protein n=1 Tax=Botryobasidium botryosum (strain FD-172 SS1) TaxID=930990 RepID=A0A067MPU8_BOTB1|nr:hypothetical protein BOTBODRAFT_175342 [Botryobasidium botryosum FD-172 SS1]
MAPTAQITWGFFISRDKLPSLLRCFRQHDPDYQGSNLESTDSEHPDGITGELQEYLDKALEAIKFDGAFLCEPNQEEGDEDDRESVNFMITHAQSRIFVESSGSYGIPTAVQLGPVIYDPSPLQALVRQLEVDLHLVEAGIEVPVKEQWILSVDP